MPNVIDYLLRPIADGLIVASETAEQIATLAAHRVREFCDAPMKFPGKRPFSTLLGVVGAFSGASSAMSIAGMVLGGASLLAAPVAIPLGAAIGVGFMSLNVMGFTATVYGGIRTIASGYEMYSEGLRNAGVTSKNALSKAKTAISSATPDWVKKPFKQTFNAFAKKKTPKVKTPAPAPTPKQGAKMSF